jgi:thioredoxin-like negative regulator of GroEL
MRMMSSIKTLFMVLGFGALLFAGSALAAGKQPYEAMAFEQSLKAGGPVLVHVEATWCSTCRRQAPTLQSLVTDGSIPGAQLYVVDFDKDRPFLKTQEVRSQATILVFNGGKEVARFAGVTNAADIRQRILGALKAS